MAKLRVFISYSHKDREMKEAVEVFLFQLKESDIISVWQDGELTGGEVFSEEIATALRTADIILLLISQDFVVSPFIRKEELSVAMERHEMRETRVVPVILRSCNWQSQLYGKLVALPRDGKPVSTWPDKDEAYTSIAAGVQRVADSVLQRKQDTASGA